MSITEPLYTLFIVPETKAAVSSHAMLKYVQSSLQENKKQATCVTSWSFWLHVLKGGHEFS